MEAVTNRHLPRAEPLVPGYSRMALQCLIDASCAAARFLQWRLIEPLANVGSTDARCREWLGGNGQRKVVDYIDPLKWLDNFGNRGH